MVIVNLTPPVESSLGMCLIAQRSEIRHFGLETAMETLVLPTPLRMIGPSMDQLDAKLQKPDPQACPLVGHTRAPWVIIVAVDRQRHAIAAKDHLKLGLYGLKLLVEASFYRNSKAGMIIDDGQGGAPVSAANLRTALGIYLLEEIWCFTLEMAVCHAITCLAMRPLKSPSRRHRMP